MKIVRSTANASCLIWTMGHVGSITLLDAIPGAQHFHDLYGFPTEDRTAFQSLRAGLARVVTRRIAHRERSKIVTAIRDPLQRNISGFFHSLHFYLTQYYRMSSHIHDDIADQGPDFLAQVFQEVFDHYSPRTWFDNEIHRFIGRSIFEKDVIPNELDDSWNGSWIVPGNNPVLVVETTRIRDCVVVIEKFLGQKGLHLSARNTAEYKWYKSLRRAFEPLDETVSLYRDIYSKHPFFGRYAPSW